MLKQLVEKLQYQWVKLTQTKPNKRHARDLQAFQAGYRWASEEYKRHGLVELIHRHLHGRNDPFDRGASKWLADNKLPDEIEINHPEEWQ